MEEQGSVNKQSVQSGSSKMVISPTASGGKGRGRPKKLSFSPAACRKLGVGLDIGHKVMVRWSDGLFYQGEVLRVDDGNDRCQIRFEEGSTFYVLFKDIHKVPSVGDTPCCVCKGETSSAPNRIAICDNCGMGFHQLCHNPPIAASDIQSPVSFFCRLCAFATRVKYEGSLKFSTPVTTKDDMKQILPYKMNLLTWDAQHRTNVEQCYCYCGGPGDWYSKMLQCCRCRQWFHEACVPCLQHRLLYGDRFFMFVCCHCNQGQEYLKRLPFKWVDLAHLALFNLTLCNSHKYYDLHDLIMPWLAKHRISLGLDQLLDGKSIESDEFRNKIETALMGHKSKFTSGREVKKKYTLWALILRVPPNAPSVVVPLSGPINTDVLNNPSIKGRKTKHVFPSQCQSPIPLKYPSRSSLDQSLSIMFKNASNRKVMPETNNNRATGNGADSDIEADFTDFGFGGNTVNDRYSDTGEGLTNRLSAAQCYNGFNGVLEASRSNGHNGVHSTRSSSESGEDSEDPTPPPPPKKATVLRTLRRCSKSRIDTTPCAGETPPQSSPPPVHRKSSPASSPPSKPPALAPSLLDRLVPRLGNFEGMNHPFRTEIEREVERKKVRHFESRVAFLRKEYAEELASLAHAHSTGTIWHDKLTTHKSAPQLQSAPPPQLKPMSSPSHPHKATSSPSPQLKARKAAKRKQSSSWEAEAALDTDCVRRSKRTRMSAERYQHLLDSFPRHMPKPDPSEAAAQRWKWLSVVDQLRYGEKFSIQARRTDPDGSLHFLLHWDDGEGSDLLSHSQ